MSSLPVTRCHVAMNDNTGITQKNVKESLRGKGHTTTSDMHACGLAVPDFRSMTSRAKPKFSYVGVN